MILTAVLLTATIFGISGLGGVEEVIGGGYSECSWKLQGVYSVFC